MTITDYLPFSIRFLKGTGLIPSSNIFRKVISVTIFLSMTLMLNVLIIVNFSQTKGEILLKAEAFESLATYSQLTVRKFIFFFHGPVIEEIIRECRHEWQYSLFGPEIEAKLRKKLHFGINLMKMLFVTSISTICLMGATALVDKSKPVPLMVWIPDIPWATEVIFIAEMIILLETMYYVMASDSFYLLVGANLQVQLQLIAQTVKSIRFGTDDDAACLQKLTDCVKHHRWVLRLHRKLNRVFSEYFIVQFTITVSTVAIQTYLILYSAASFDAIIRSVVYFISVMLQVALYFIPASNIEIEGENFSASLYFANWEANTSVKVNKHLLFMMMESQKPLHTLGAGMLHISRPMYFGIVRLGFTIATILGGFK